MQGWIIAALAEAQTAIETWTITLTYRPGHDGEVFLRYSDVQKMFKRLRKAGHQFRYICAGEYGSAKGRPHWHLMIFWQSPPPDRGEVIGKSDCGTYERRHWQYWAEAGVPIGHVVIDPTFDYRTARYVAKYITKGDGASKFTASKKPGIGQDYFDDHARRHGKAGAPPQRNVFKVDGFTAGISENRWKRYKIICQEAYAEAGHGKVIPLKPYENTISDRDKRELQAARDELNHWAKKIMDQVKIHDIRPVHRKGTDCLVVYKRGAQNFMRLETGRETEWLSGLCHMLDGSFKDHGKPRKGRITLDLAISERQAETILQRKKPLPEADPEALSDFLTPEAARLRKQSGTISRAARVLQSSNAISYARHHRESSSSGRGQ